MENSDTDSDSNADEVSRPPYWNDWLPPMEQCNQHEGSHTKDVTTKFVCNQEVPSIDALGDTSKFGHWIPPLNFAIEPKKYKRHFGPEDKRKYDAPIKPIASITEEVISASQAQTTVSNAETGLKRKINLDWGERVELHDVSRFNDGQLVWGTVSLGSFGNIKLWTNKYGYVCGSAEGTVSKLGSSEAAFISVTEPELLRKMLDLSKTQWSSLCDVLQETKSTLKFDALQDYHLNSKTSLERLWLLLCKRRHLLPMKCMLVKLSGAIKCMRQFKITPKLVVHDIRYIDGQPIY